MTQGGHKAATDHVHPGTVAVEVGRRLEFSRWNCRGYRGPECGGGEARKKKPTPGPLHLLLPPPGMLFPKWILIQSFTC